MLPGFPDYRCSTTPYRTHHTPLPDGVGYSEVELPVRLDPAIAVPDGPARGAARQYRVESIEFGIGSALRRQPRRLCIQGAADFQEIVGAAVFVQALYDAGQFAGRRDVCAVTSADVQ
nr:hypothetical protein [Rhodococcus erythropolis]